MSKYFRFFLLLMLFVSLTSMEIHKFYMAIYQIDYVPQKKRIQITSRIFVDDLNAAIEKKYHVKSNLGTSLEMAQDEVNMKKYLAEKFFLKVNGVVKPMVFLSKEVEANVLICYFRIPDISKITNLEVENSALTEWNSEQQNIIQATINGQKQSEVLTSENYKRVLK